MFEWLALGTFLRERSHFQSSRDLEVTLKSHVLCSVSQVSEFVTSKRPVLSIAFHKFQNGCFEIEKACSVLHVTHQHIREDSVTF